MARMILDPTTPRELLWRDALGLVAELTGSIASAKALLISYLPENIRLRFALMDGYRSPGFPAKSAPDAQGREPPEDMRVRWVNRDPAPYDQRFWHPDEAAGERLISYDEDSSFRWSGPPKWLPLPYFKPPPTDFTVTLLWLDRDDIIKVLRFAGLLPSAVPADASSLSQPAPQSQLPSGPEPKRETLKNWLPGAVKAHPKPQPEWSDAQYAKYLRKFAPKDWEKSYVANGLSELKRETTPPEPDLQESLTKKSLSQKVSQK